MWQLEAPPPRDSRPWNGRIKGES